MSDRWNAELTVKGWPGLVPEEPHRGAGGTTYTMPRLDIDSLRASDSRELADLADILECNPPDDVRLDPDGELYALWNDSTGGIYGIEEIRDALKAAGLAYRAWDEGMYENPGEEERWDPAEKLLVPRAVLAGGEIALPEHQARQATAGDTWDQERYAALGRWVASYFELEREEATAHAS